VGQTLTAEVDSVGAEGVYFQWRRVNLETNTGDNIGAGYGTYYVCPDDLGYRIVVVVTRPGYSNAIRSDPTTPVIDLDHGADLAIRYRDFLRGTIGHLPITLGGAPETASKRIILLDPRQYDPGSIEWLIGGAEVPRAESGGGVSGDYGEILTVDARLLGYGIGIHVLTIIVRGNGLPYSKLVHLELRYA